MPTAPRTSSSAAWIADISPSGRSCFLRNRRSWRPSQADRRQINWNATHIGVAGGEPIQEEHDDVIGVYIEQGRAEGLPATVEGFCRTLDGRSAGQEGTRTDQTCPRAGGYIVRASNTRYPVKVHCFFLFKVDYSGSSIPHPKKIVLLSKHTVQPEGETHSLATRLGSGGPSF